MKHDLKNLCNDGLINSCKKIAELIPTQLEADHLTELITRFERLSLGQQADEACKKAEELQQHQQQDDEVEALAREIFIHTNMEATYSVESSFDLAEQFINHRNERRGKK
jgi:hypothetical protein